MDEVLSIQTQWFAKHMNVDTAFRHIDIRDGVVQRGGQEREDEDSKGGRLQQRVR